MDIQELCRKLRDVHTSVRITDLCEEAANKIESMESELKSLRELHDAVYNPAENGGWGRQ